jgi:hypothetical protein
MVSTSESSVVVTVQDAKRPETLLLPCSQWIRFVYTDRMTHGIFTPWWPNVKGQKVTNDLEKTVVSLTNKEYGITLVRPGRTLSSRWLTFRSHEDTEAAGGIHTKKWLQINDHKLTKSIFYEFWILVKIYSSNIPEGRNSWTFRLHVYCTESENKEYFQVTNFNTNCLNRYQLCLKFRQNNLCI